MALARQVMRYNEAVMRPVTHNVTDDDHLVAEPVKHLNQDAQEQYSRPSLMEHLDLLKELEYNGPRILCGPRVYGGGKTKFNLPQFRIPERIWELICRRTVLKQYNTLNQLLTPDNYVDKFQTLLWLEEAEQDIEMRRHDLKETNLDRRGRDSFSIWVPGLARGSPSLTRGDKFVLRDLQRDLMGDGYIHEISGNKISAKLHKHLQNLIRPQDEFDVLFIKSRTAHRRAHLGAIKTGESKTTKLRVFPEVQLQLKKPLLDIDAQEHAEDLIYFTKCLNPYQKAAVINALRAECRPAPYIIFGPPGTGKTLTLVEVILQAYTRKGKAKILICANSNACVDKLAQDLKKSGHIRRRDIIRLAAYRRIDEKLIPKDIGDITTGLEEMGPRAYSRARIIVTTCIQSGCLHEFSDKFDYLFIDEAGHATEPEAMLPVSLLKEEGVCVLAGDPRQLGPVCFSTLARRRGLSTSLLERLADRDVYKLQAIDGKQSTYDARYISQLIVSFRCDRRVLAISNELFYNNALRCDIKTPAKWLKMLKVEHPLVFCSIKGQEERTHPNPSWFNPLEAAACIEYAKKLYKAGLKPEQLGIISPYKRQIEELHTLFEKSALKKCKIASMEQFQGDEREIIIITTVRTGRKQSKLDVERRRLQFLFDPKRFNVALSRAKWMVITVGDYDTLTIDKCWRKYMEQASKIELVN